LDTPVYTYRKNVKDVWPEEEFKEHKVTFPSGEEGVMKLAERTIYLKTGKIEVREVRKLTKSGHQTSIVTTDFITELAQVAPNMFARWSQENYFKYMMEHYDIDRLVEYKKEKIDEEVMVRNPKYNALEHRLRSLNGKLTRRKAEFGGLILKQEIEDKEVKIFIQRKSTLQEDIRELEKEIGDLKNKKSSTDVHIHFKNLPVADKFDGLAGEKKNFMDTIKMIAYRAETAMVSLLRSHMLKKDEARTLVRQILTTDADLIPDKEKGELKVRLHNLTNPRNIGYVKKITQVLNETETVFPGTNLRLTYELVSN
jgi:Transposase protein